MNQTVEAAKQSVFKLVLFSSNAFIESLPKKKGVSRRRMVIEKVIK